MNALGSAMFIFSSGDPVGCGKYEKIARLTRFSFCGGKRQTDRSAGITEPIKIHTKRSLAGLAESAHGSERKNDPQHRPF
jgi:hypothetical protein